MNAKNFVRMPSYTSFAIETSADDISTVPVDVASNCREKAQLRPQSTDESQSKEPKQKRMKNDEPLQSEKGSEIIRPLDKKPAKTEEALLLSPSTNT
jgi:hypothetical protein